LLAVLQYTRLGQSLLTLPGIAAEHNKNVSNHPIKVMVSFDLSPASRIQLPAHAEYKNSFEVAIHYAEMANKVSPGTVDTLLLHHDDYLRVRAKNRLGHLEVPNLLHSARETLDQLKNNENVTKYKLGVTISLALCGNDVSKNLTYSSQILSKFVKYADLVIPVVYVEATDFDSDSVDFTPQFEHAMQLESFKKCEQALKLLKPQVEIIPLVICNDPKSRSGDGLALFFQCWRLMSNWAKENERRVIMYEAFDRSTSDPDYISSVGWWRLKNGTDANITETSFEQKRQSEISSLDFHSRSFNNSVEENVTNKQYVVNEVNGADDLNIKTNLADEIKIRTGKSSLNDTLNLAQPDNLDTLAAGANDEQKLSTTEDEDGPSPPDDANLQSNTNKPDKTNVPDETTNLPGTNQITHCNLL